jgi:DNA repair exonuclease SbcCD ATPase subunit
MEFDNIYIFGVANVVDFRLLENCVSGVISSNHSGKSSLIEAILFVLYEKYPRTKSIKDLIHQGSKTCSISLDFELDGKIGRIEKAFGLTQAKTSQYRFMYASEVLTRGTTTDTLKEIEKYVGCAETALSSCFQLQGTEIGSFMSLTHLDRKKLLTSVLSLGSFTNMEKSVSSEYTKASARADVLNNQYLGTTVIELEERYETILSDQETIKDECADLLSNLNELRVAETNLLISVARFNNTTSPIPINILTALTSAECLRQIDLLSTTTEHLSAITGHSLNTTNSIDNISKSIDTTKIDYFAVPKDIDYTRLNSINTEVELLKLKANEIESLFVGHNKGDTKIVNDSKNTGDVKSIANKISEMLLHRKKLEDSIIKLTSDLKICENTSTSQYTDPLLLDFAFPSERSGERVFPVFINTSIHHEDSSRASLNTASISRASLNTASISCMSVNTGNISEDSRNTFTSALTKYHQFETPPTNQSYDQKQHEQLIARLNKLTLMIVSTTVSAIDTQDALAKSLSQTDALAKHSENTRLYDTSADEINLALLQTRKTEMNQQLTEAKIKLKQLKQSCLFTKDRPIIPEAVITLADINADAKLLSLKSKIKHVDYIQELRSKHIPTTNCSNCNNITSLLTLPVNQEIIDAEYNLHYLNSAICNQNTIITDQLDQQHCILQQQYDSLKQQISNKIAANDIIKQLLVIEQNKVNHQVYTEYQQAVSVLERVQYWINKDKETLTRTNLCRLELKQAISALNELNQQITLYENDASNRNKHNQITSHIKQLLIEKQTLINQIQHNHQWWSEALEGIKLLDDMILLNTTKQELEAVKQKMIPINRQLAVCNKRIALLDVEIGKIKQMTDQENIRSKNHEEAVIERDILSLYKSVLKPNNGIGDILLEQTRELFVKSINTHLSDLGARFKVNVTPDYDIVHRVDGSNNWLSAGLTSGYQKFVLNLSVRLSLWKLSSLPRPDAVIIDEGFGVCDEDYLGLLADAMDLLITASDAPRMLFIVSHIDALKMRLAKALNIQVFETYSYINNSTSHSSSSTHPVMPVNTSITKTISPSVILKTSISNTHTLVNPILPIDSPVLSSTNFVLPVAAVLSSLPENETNTTTQDDNMLIKSITKQVKDAPAKFDCKHCRQVINPGYITRHLESQKHKTNVLTKRV